MADVTRIWIETAHHAAFRCGGWAFVLSDAGAVSGAVGGARTPSAEAVALAGLAQALKAPPPGVGLEVHSTDRWVLSVPARLSGAGETPSEDLELWAPIATALKARPVRFVRAENRPKTPSAFAVAWSELARDKAKAAGAFRAAIPRPNLAKAGI